MNSPVLILLIVVEYAHISQDLRNGKLPALNSDWSLLDLFNKSTFLEII